MSKSRKKPADHLPAKGAQLTIETPAGVVRIPKFNVTAGFLRKNRDKPEIDLMFGLLELHASDKALEILDELSIEDLKEFFETWQEESGAILGESSRS